MRPKEFGALRSVGRAAAGEGARAPEGRARELARVRELARGRELGRVRELARVRELGRGRELAQVRGLARAPEEEAAPEEQGAAETTEEAAEVLVVEEDWYRRAEQFARPASSEPGSPGSRSETQDLEARKASPGETFVGCSSDRGPADWGAVPC
jgi:hypothetical protein